MIRPRYSGRVLLLDPRVGAGASADEVANAIVSAHFVIVRDGRPTTGGFPSGSYSIWINPGFQYAPLILPNVELRDGVNDLGAPTFTAGSKLRVRVLVADGESVPLYTVGLATVARGRDGSPLYRRREQSDGETEITVTGLRRGEWSIRCGDYDGNIWPTPPTITLDGEHDELIVIDLRDR